MNLKHPNYTRFNKLSSEYIAYSTFYSSPDFYALNKTEQNIC